MPFQPRKPEEWTGPATMSGGIPWDLRGRTPADVLPYVEPNDWGRGGFGSDVGPKLRPEGMDDERADDGGSQAMRALMQLIQRSGG